MLGYLHLGHDFVIKINQLSHDNFAENTCSTCSICYSIEKQLEGTRNRQKREYLKKMIAVHNARQM